MARFVTGVGLVDRQQVIDSLSAEGLDVTEWTDDAGAAYPEHAHEHREVRVVLSGEMTMRTQRLTFVMRPGDRVDFDAGEPHSAIVGADGVTYLAGRLIGNRPRDGLTSP